MSKRILLAGNYGNGNFGDEAILAGALAGLRALDPALLASVVTADPAETIRTHGVDAVAIRDPAATREAVAAADLVVVGGGGLINDYWPIEPERVLFDPGWGLACHTLPALTAAALGKPYGFLAVGAGPLEDPRARDYVGALLSGAAFASARDEPSRQLLISCVASSKSVSLAADPAFLLNPAPVATIAELLNEHGLSPGGNWLAIALRPWSFGVGHEARVEALAQGLDRSLAAADARALFVQMQTRGGEGHADGPLALAVRERMRESARTSLLDALLPPQGMAALLGASRAVVAMRLHALLLASSCGVPGVPIEYDPKVGSLAAELGLGQLTLSLGELSADRLTERIGIALREREPLSLRVTERREALRERARAGVETILRELDRPEEVQPLPRLLGAGALAGAREVARTRRESQASREDLVREIDCLRSELQPLRQEQAQSLEKGAAAEARLGEALEQLSQAQVMIAGHREELRRIQTSRLWKVGNLYWSARRRLGMSPADPASPTRTVGSPREASEAPQPAPSVAARHRQNPPDELLARAASSAGTVIILPSVAWGIHLFQRPHHLARTFARRGYFTIYDCSNGGDDVDGFLELEPNLFLFRGELESLHPFPSPLLWSFPYNFHLCAGFPEGAVALYDWIDDLAVFPYDVALLERNHRDALARAPLVASVAQRLHREAEATRRDAIYLPNAVDPDHFASPPPPPEDPAFAAVLASGRHVAGYYGALADWFDFDLIAALAEARDDWAFVLIGPDYEGALTRHRPLLRRENIAVLGPRDYAVLPAYLARFDVATIPFRINDITLATSPLKLFEYFAGGKPVVTSPMPECQAFPEVIVADSPTAFAAGLDEARRRAAVPAFRARLRELARANDWETRIDTVLPRWEAKRHLPRPRSAWTGHALTTATAPPRDPDLPVVAAPSADSKPAAVTLDSASDLATRFSYLRPAGDRRFFDALLAHLAGVADHPFAPVYVEYAATTVARGRQAVAALMPHVPLAGARVLDIGCAYGGFLVALAEAGAAPLGIDVNERLLALARLLAADHETAIALLHHDATADRRDFHGRFDLIVANDVIEHVAGLEALLANLARWLAPGGLVYLEIPNGRHPGFVRRDGHHGAFAVSLLDFDSAAAILRESGLATAYDTFNYLTLEEYRARFAAHGLCLELMTGWADGLSREVVLAEMEALRREWRERVASEIPGAHRPQVSAAIEAYLAGFDGSGAAAHDNEVNLFTSYGASFWRVLCRRAEPDPSA